MTRTDEINAEIRNQAVRLHPKCAGLFELPLMVYTQIVADNLTRSKPYRLSVERCKKNHSGNAGIRLIRGLGI